MGGCSPQLQLDRGLSELVLNFGSCERLIYTPVPLSYTRHTSRRATCPPPHPAPPTPFPPVRSTSLKPTGRCCALIGRFCRTTELAGVFSRTPELASVHVLMQSAAMALMQLCARRIRMTTEGYD